MGSVIVAPLLAVAREPWLQRNQYMGVWFGVGLTVVSVLIGAAVFWHSRPECQVGPARFVRANADHAVYAINFHIVATGHWRLKRLDVVFSVNGARCPAEQIAPAAMIGVGERTEPLVFQVDRPDGAMDLSVSVRFKHGKRATYGQVLPPQ